VNTIFDIYTQKLNATGTALWTNNGVAVISTNQNETVAAVIPNGSGGAVVAWQNENNLRLMMQNISNAGAQSWLSTGLFVTPASDIVNSSRLVLDSNKQYICVYEAFNSISSIQAQKLNNAGNILWNISGVPIANKSNSTPAALTAVLSKDTTLIAAWEDFRNPTINIYSSKLLTNGTLAGTTNPNYITIANGNWNNAAIWNKNSLPPINANVTIRHIVNVNITATVKTLDIMLPGGLLTISTGNTFTVVN
ncbi:MAG: hypothetical protein WD135_07485, partial [Ferruginibacter sp.]